MSRNLRHKSSTKEVARKSIKMPSVRDASSDDDYSGVDLISDADEDEPDVEVAEEQAIIEEEEDDNDATLQPDTNDDDDDDDDQSSWAGFDVDDEDLRVLSDCPVFEEHRSRMATPTIHDEVNLFAAASSRRVRFDLSDSDTSSAEENGVFPDIFLDQNSLDPAFRQTIENDLNIDNDDPPSDDGSYWDFRGEEFEVTGGNDIEVDEESESSSCGSSGYETDEGETTEEDLPPAAQYVPARTVLRRQSTDSSESEEEITVVRRNPYRSQRPNGPKLGSWVTDASKPFAVIDSRGKKMVMFRARINRRYSFNDIPAQSDQNFVEAPTPGSQEQLSPMLSNSANLMMSAMYTPLDNILEGAALGPPEAFYPFVSISANGAITQDEPLSSSFDEDDLDDDDMWNITDLIDFGDETSDDGDGMEDVEDGNSSAADPSSTPIRPTTASSEDQVHPLLEHLDRGLVGAFRRNQTRHQLLVRNAASARSLAFSGAYYEGTLRGIKGGRLAAANASMTPARKSKSVKLDLTLTPTPAEGSNGEKKRKFSDEHRGHKRSRSLF